MSRLAISLALLLLGAPLLAKTHVPTAKTKAAIKQYVRDAAGFIAKHGADCTVLMGPDWRAGDYYVFVDADGKTFCHPDSTMIGKPNASVVDVNGKNVGTAIEAAANKKGGGWVSYMWPRPGTTKPVAKSTFATTVKAPDGKTYIVGAGAYDLK